MAEVTPATTPRILPYSYIVGQEALRRALELAFVAPDVDGVLISGERGTAKSTTVRAFAQMAYGGLPVTLPLNATDDRVMGGWRIDRLMRGETKRQPGLIQQAGESGLLYIDEVNLLDDYLANIILDVASTGVVVVQREGIDERAEVARFTLVGTMNPEEGRLRPQLLDRFGLLVPVTAHATVEDRTDILLTVMRFEQESVQDESTWLDLGRKADQELQGRLLAARKALPSTRLGHAMAKLCATIAMKFGVAGHRGEIVMGWAARASAAQSGRTEVSEADVRSVAPYAIAHRRRDLTSTDSIEWTDQDWQRLDAIIAGALAADPVL